MKVAWKLSVSIGWFKAGSFGVISPGFWTIFRCLTTAFPVQYTVQQVGLNHLFLTRIDVLIVKSFHNEGSLHLYVLICPLFGFGYKEMIFMGEFGWLNYEHVTKFFLETLAEVKMQIQMHFSVRFRWFQTYLVNQAYELISFHHIYYLLLPKNIWNCHNESQSPFHHTKY